MPPLAGRLPRKYGAELNIEYVPNFEVNTLNVLVWVSGVFKLVALASASLDVRKKYLVPCLCFLCSC